MIHEMFLRSTEVHVTTNGDGTHSIIVVTAEEKMEFSCILRPHLTVHIEVDDKMNRVLLANGEHLVMKPQARLRLGIEGDILPTPEGQNWMLRVLDVDACGNPKER